MEKLSTLSLLKLLKDINFNETESEKSIIKGLVNKIYIFTQSEDVSVNLSYAGVYANSEEEAIKIFSKSECFRSMYNYTVNTINGEEEYCPLCRNYCIDNHDKTQITDEQWLQIFINDRDYIISQFYNILC
jgi:hypothetical protein